MDPARRLLIIDDEEVVLDSCRAILEGEGFLIETESSGDAGLKRLREWGPDLLLVDLKMPGISGLEVLEQLEDIDPGVVAIVITGYATVASAVDAMKRGAYDFLPKPFTPDELRLIVRRGVEKRELVLETMELRREREVLRENFAAIVSHELKSPLGAVQQNLFLLEHELADAVTEEQQARIGRMQVRIGQLVEMVDAWLRGVSVDARRIRERFKPVPLNLLWWDLTGEGREFDGSRVQYDVFDFDAY